MFSTLLLLQVRPWSHLIWDSPSLPAFDLASWTSPLCTGTGMIVPSLGRIFSSSPFLCAKVPGCQPTIHGFQAFDQPLQPHLEYYLSLFQSSLSPSLCSCLKAHWTHPTDPCLSALALSSPVPQTPFFLHLALMTNIPLSFAWLTNALEDVFKGMISFRKPFTPSSVS